MLDRRDAGKVGCRTGGMREGPDSGLDGYRKQRFRTGVSDSELEEYLRERRNTGKEEYRKGGMQKSRHAGKEVAKEGFKTGRTQDWRYT